MRQLILVATSLFCATVFAQEGPVISSAIIAIDRNNDLPTAKKYIDEAQDIVGSKPQSEIKSKDLSKFYFYKGKINYRVYQSNDPEVSGLDAAALDKALEGYRQLLDFEEQGKKRYYKDAAEQLQYIATDIARRGIAASQERDFKQAYSDFMESYRIKKHPAINQEDTTMLYNAAIMAQQGQMFDEALEINESLIATGYKGVNFTAVSAESGDTVVFPSKPALDNAVRSGKFVNPTIAGDVRPDLYTTSAYLALEKGDTALYKEKVAQGRAKYPENRALLTAELQLFFDNKEYDKALANLDQAIAQDPENVVMYYNKGVILQNEMKRTDDALEAYRKALEIDSTYADALYMTSIIYIDKANALGEKINELPISAEKEYKKLKAEQDGIFEESLPYLERAYAANPSDGQVVSALMGVYRALKMYDKAMALKKTSEE